MPSAQDVTNFQNAKQAHYDNADFKESASITKANAFITACIRLKGMLPKSQSHGERGGESIAFDHKSLDDDIARAEKYVSQKSGSVGGFSGLRSQGDYCR